MGLDDEVYTMNVFDVKAVLANEKLIGVWEMMIGGWEPGWEVMMTDDDGR